MRNFKWENMSPPEIASYLELISDHCRSMRGGGGGGSCLDALFGLAMYAAIFLTVLGFVSLFVYITSGL